MSNSVVHRIRFSQPVFGIVVAFACIFAAVSVSAEVDDRGSPNIEESNPETGIPTLEEDRKSQQSWMDLLNAESLEARGREYDQELEAAANAYLDGFVDEIEKQLFKAALKPGKHINASPEEYYDYLASENEDGKEVRDHINTLPEEYYEFQTNTARNTFNALVKGGASVQEAADHVKNLFSEVPIPGSALGNTAEAESRKIVGYMSMGKIKGMEIEVREVVDASTLARTAGILVKIPRTYSSTLNISYIAPEEIPDFLAALDYMYTANKRYSEHKKFELQYKTKDGLNIVVFNDSRGSLKFSMEIKGAVTNFKMKDIPKIKELIIKATYI